MRVTVDKENKIVDVEGYFQVKRPYYLHSWREVIHKVQWSEKSKKTRDIPKISDVPSFNVLEPVEPITAKAFTQKYGSSPTSVKKAVNKHIRDLWYAEWEDGDYNFIKNHCIELGAHGKVNIHKVELLNKHREQVLRAYNDNQINLISLCIITGLYPKEIKDMLTKGEWKKLLHISKYHSDLIATSINLLLGSVTIEDKHKDIIGTLKMLLTLRSSYLRTNINAFLYYPELIPLHHKLCIEGRILRNKMKSHRLLDIVADTEQMLDQLGRELNPKWSLKRLKEEHDKAALEINRQQHSDEVFPVLLEKSYPEVILHPDQPELKATLLKSALEIATEGSAMHHCVGSYASRVGEGRYLVYSITRDGERVSTLGLSVRQPTGDSTPRDNSPYGKVVNSPLIQINQHYGQCNQKVTDEHAVELSLIVHSQLSGVPYTPPMKISA